MKKFILVLLTMMAFTSYAIENQPNTNGDQPGKESVKFSKIRCALGLGMSRLFTDNTSMFNTNDEHKAKLKNGTTFNLGVSYFFYPQFGFGARFKAFGARGEIKEPFENGELTLYDFKERPTYHFFGFEALGRFFHDKRHNLIVSGAVGFLSFNDNFNFNIAYYPSLSPLEGVTYGRTFAGAIDLGYDFKLTENIAIGVDLSMVMGTLTRWLTKTDRTLMNTETIVDRKDGRNLYRFDLTIGIRFLSRRK